jgi:tRNA nucleotidyltransferase/poly(A) polymerase
MFKMNQIQKATQVVRILQDAGAIAVLAGGCVRDMLLGVEPHDVDIATNFSPDQVEALFRDTIPVGKAFGVVRVRLFDEEFEVATFRKDVGSDGRRPASVEFSSMKGDAERRDLTINGMFLEIPATELPTLTEEESDILFWNIAVLMKRGVGDPHVSQQGSSVSVDISPAELPAFIKKRLEV